MKLDFVWAARFSDGVVLEQFSDMELQNSETPFREVLDRQDGLVGFDLLGVRTGLRFSVDLKNGTISMSRSDDSETIQADEDMLRSGKYDYRLIYFRRVSRTFDLKLKEVEEPRVVYFLGFQYVDENGKCHKRIIRINGNGRFIIN